MPLGKHIAYYIKCERTHPPRHGEPEQLKLLRKLIFIGPISQIPSLPWQSAASACVVTIEFWPSKLLFVCQEIITAIYLTVLGEWVVFHRKKFLTNHTIKMFPNILFQNKLRIQYHPILCRSRLNGIYQRMKDRTNSIKNFSNVRSAKRAKYEPVCGFIFFHLASVLMTERPSVVPRVRMFGVGCSNK